MQEAILLALGASQSRSTYNSSVFAWSSGALLLTSKAGDYNAFYYKDIAWIMLDIICQIPRIRFVMNQVLSKCYQHPSSLKSF